MDGNSPSIIHLSTHGFYLVGFDKYAEYFNNLLPYSIKDNSMLLSGILLADANSTLRKPNERTPLNDGIITAEEIAMLDLRNTKLVVLSACETAIGENLQEGFGGLVRAFKNAGYCYIFLYATVLQNTISDKVKKNGIYESAPIDKKRI